MCSSDLTTLLAIAGAGALGALAWMKRGSAWEHRRVAAYVLLLALVPTVAMGYAAFLGGRIAHAEIRTDAPSGGLIESVE